MIKNKLDVFVNECIRTILGIKWNDRISNEELKERHKQEPLSEKAASHIIRLAGHVWRMNDSWIARRIER